MKCTIREIQCEKALAPSRITLGEYVINPYRGCGYGCRYCYVQKNKGIQKRNELWGTFVDVKVNIGEVLNRELSSRRVSSVLIGSTTEVYQPCEEQYQLMRTLVKLLNAANVRCTILTKSPLIVRDIDLLRKNVSPVVYVTINDLPEAIQSVLEPDAPSLRERCDIIHALVNIGINTHVYVNPVLPLLTNPDALMNKFNGIATHLDFESINPTMTNWALLRNDIQPYASDTIEKLDNIFTNKDLWDAYWHSFEEYLKERNTYFRYSMKTFFHPFASYFEHITY